MKKVVLPKVVLFIVITIIFAFVCYRKYHYQTFSRENAHVLESSKIITLEGIKENGFTCTGAVYDPESNSFYVGDCGKMKPDEKIFKAKIHQLSTDFKNEIRVIDCYKSFKSMKDIQGVTIDDSKNIWFCSYGENLVRCVNQEGDEIGAFHVDNPSGIAFDYDQETVWVLTDRYLIKYSKDFKEINRYYFRVKGQDQLFYDAENKVIYITAGDDYHGENFVYTFDVMNEKFQLEYILKDSYAIEGIVIIDNDMYILNDGFYHGAKVPVNQVNIYRIHR